MKKLYFITLLIFSCLKLAAQEKVYKIDAAGVITPAIATDESESIRFVIDKHYKGKNIFVFLEDGTTKVNGNSAILDRDFLKDGAGSYPVVIKSDHTIEHCTNCSLSVSDVFSIELDGKKIGPFHLKASGEEIVTTTAAPATPSYQAGSVIKDALFIAEGSNIGTIREILKSQYKVTSANIDENFFLKAGLPVGTLTGVESSLDLSSIGNTLGGLNVTTLADGFAKFIVKRTKQELSIAFFKRFKDDIVNNDDLKAAFPNTSAVLFAIDEQIYNYSNYINNLREAFRSDLQVIDENLPTVIDNHADFFNKPENVKLKIALKSAFYITSSLRHKIHPGDILDGYPTNLFDDPATAKPYPEFYLLKGSVQSVQLLSESMKETDTTKHTYWVKIDKVRLLVNNQKALQIYIGLLLQVAKIKYDKITYTAIAGDDFYSKINTQPNANNFSKDYQEYKQYVLGVGNQVEELNKMIKEYDKIASDSLKVEQYAKYFKTTVQLLQSATDISNLPHLKTITGLNTLRKDSREYFDIAYEVADLTTAVNRKNYPEVINHVIVIYNKVYVQPRTAQVDNSKVKELSRKEKLELADKVIAQNGTDASQSIASVISKDAKVSAAIQGKDDDAGDAARVSGLLVKYGAFMSNMINAKTSDEVATTIESVALPVGSSSIKRETVFNVSLNAYCGLFVGNEVIKGVDENKPFKKFNSFGVTAPIGISISRGNHLFFVVPGKGWSTSLFLSIVDLGAVAAYRFNDDKTEQVPEIKLKDIFSPGIFLSLGIPKTPISLNFGTEIGPNLRKVTTDANDYSGKLYTRYSLSVCVDIPLLNLYTKSKN